MAGENREKPFAPSTAGFHRLPKPISIDSDEFSIELKRRDQTFRKRTLCCGIISATILVVALVMLVLGFTVFHLQNPRIRITTASITGFDRVNLTSPPNEIANATLTADVYIKNPNVASFKYESSSSSLFYYDVVVGNAGIPEGAAKAKRTTRLNVRFNVVTRDIARHPQFQSDYRMGFLPLRSYTSIKGKVKMLNMEKNVMGRLNCTVIVNLTSQEIANQECKRHISI